MPATTPATRCRVLGWSGAPKRSAFIAAIGLAPMVKTSRRMPPTAGRRALVGLDVGGVVVALHLEDDRLAVADVDHAGVLARPLDDARAFGRQCPQPALGGLVRAVLVPHGRKDAELGEARLAADQVEDALVFVRLQPVRGDQLGRNGKRVGDGHAELLRRVPSQHGARSVPTFGSRLKPPPRSSRRPMPSASHRPRCARRPNRPSAGHRP